MMVKSSVRLSVSEIEDEEAVACFNAQCVGHQSLWDEGINGYSIGERGGGWRMLAGGSFRSPNQQKPPTTPRQY